MKNWLRQRWYNARDAFRDHVWRFAAWIDPAVAQEDRDRFAAVEQLQRYAMVGMPMEKRVPFLILSTPQQIAELALRKASAECFSGSLDEAAERAREIA